MLISKAVGILALGVAAVTASSVAGAAPIETQQIDSWTLNAWTSEKTGNFQSCSMRTPGNEQVYLNLSANPRGRWYLSLYRARWDLELNDRFIATLNLDDSRKEPIALDARVNSVHFLSLIVPPQEHVLDLLSKAAKVRVSREAKAYTFTLAGYDKAVQWVKACVVRNAEQEASKPDGTIKGEDEDTDSGIVEVHKEKPAEPPKGAPRLPADVIETKADEPAGRDAVVAAGPPASVATKLTMSAPAPVPAERPAPTIQVATASASASIPPMSDAAKASPMPIVERPAPAISPAQALLPNLMAAANRSDFKLLDVAAAPEALKRADVVFGLTGITGAVMAFDLPTAEAATNEVLAYDRIACGGTYSAVTNPVEEGHADVLRSTSECKTGDKSGLAHYVTLSRKSGGFFVIALTGKVDTPAAGGTSDKLAEADRALLDAAIKVSGKF